MQRLLLRLLHRSRQSSYGIFSLGAFLLSVLPFASHATCYTVYNKNERVIFQSENPPVDMTQAGIAQEVRSKFGADAVMIFNDNAACTEILALEEPPAPVSITAPAAKSSAPPAPTAPKVEKAVISAGTGNTNTNTGSFRCDGRKHCSQMTSCDEAAYFLKNCPGTKMDGNGDGIPCEKQWCGHKKR